jgi:hypothetical protein
MKIDATARVTGGALDAATLDIVDLVAELTPAPAVLTAEAYPNTLSITHLFIDSSSGGTTNVDPDPEPDLTEFFGVPSMHLGFGGFPPYITAYPLGGI